MIYLQDDCKLGWTTEGALTFREQLESIELFRGLPPEALDAIYRVAVPAFAYAGQTVIEEGETARHVYLLLVGRVRIQIESITPFIEVGITKLGAGEVLGEMALLGEEPRSATVVAIEPCEFARIPAAELQRLIDRRPDWGVILLRNLNKIMGRRLRMMNRRMLNYVRTRGF